MKSPRDRATRHLAALKRGAAFAVAAAVGPVSAGCDDLPPLARCASTSDRG
ncbi:MAG TPA: hypothetical protein VGO62_05985 [Myxococcota bacterium]